ncbi:hypothetical protein CHARACLAT_006557 [Characodon lateralis]|uniref:Uncharacterized protein n=1 Tax=Characodon lateralis TaxID=208331 RepID=A0ABU7CVZ6_9TELE|nr:hypothetical protein [Characodon lateralis]
MNMGIQDQCLGRESPTCLFPGPRFLEITFYQLLRTIPPANLSHRGKDLFLPNLAKSSFFVSLTLTDFSIINPPLLKRSLSLSSPVRSQSCPLTQSGFQNEPTFVNQINC